MSNSNYCEIHLDNIALFRCSKCSRGVCSRCSEEGSSFCPRCSGRNVTQEEKKSVLKQIRNILISGLALCFVSILINTTIAPSYFIEDRSLFYNSMLFLLFGISFASAVYFHINSTLFDEVLEVHYFGKKIVKYLIIGTSVTGIPIIYFLYLLYNYFKKEN